MHQHLKRTAKHNGKAHAKLSFVNNSSCLGVQVRSGSIAVTGAAQASTTAPLLSSSLILSAASPLISTLFRILLPYFFYSPALPPIHPLLLEWHIRSQVPTQEQRPNNLWNTLKHLFSGKSNPKTSRDIARTETMVFERKITRNQKRSLQNPNWTNLKKYSDFGSGVYHGVSIFVGLLLSLLAQPLKTSGNQNLLWHGWDTNHQCQKPLCGLFTLVG